MKKTTFLVVLNYGLFVNCDLKAMVIRWKRINKKDPKKKPR